MKQGFAVSLVVSLILLGRGVPRAAAADGIAEAVEKIQAGAAPTQKYHEQLFKIAKEAPALTVAQLNSIVDACYITAADRDKLVKQAEELEREPDTRGNRQASREVWEKIKQADEFGAYSNKILLAGLPKTSDLTFASGVAALEKLYPQPGSSKAFRLVLGKFSKFSTDQEYRLMKLASRKDAGDVAVILGADWFKNHSDRSLDTMGQAAKDLADGDKDGFLSQALEVYPSLSSRQMLRIAGFADNAAAIVMAGHGKIRDLTPGNALKLIDVADDEGKDVLIRQCLDSTPAPTTEELSRLAQASSSWEVKDSILTTYRKNVSDPTVANTLKLVELADDQSKDALIREFLNSRKKVAADDLASLAQSASSWESKNSILTDYRKKLSDATAANILKLVELADDQSKDALITGFLDSKINLTTEELSRLAEAASSWESKNAILTAYRGKLSDQSAANTLKLVELADDENKGVLVRKFLGARRSVTTSQLIALSDAANDASGEILRGALEKVSDLTVANALLLADKMEGEEKGEFLLKAVDKVTDLSSSNLQDFAQHADDKETEVLQRGIRRLARGKGA